ncbi:sensor histidine kinase [Alteromonas sp. PRIM-21]|uniref:sensor histidine kinase n=1 Tax=Alteromonas sp. PRIM-21 TaxID=1454978 RepID=UPI0022B9A52D|nr:HAMP domain-containing sensor histidine kinase [Alteromonas sp. PRIM-21]MCZ8529400.1 HAMP domain-containing histidine kinase [Alteromonas sp. PRIM-21]
MVNGLRISLRRYVLWSLLSLATIVIVLFSIQSSDSFFDGMDGMLRNTMVRAAQSAELDNSNHAQILDLHVYANYDDLPDEIKQSFPQDSFTPFALKKNINKPNWLTRPTWAHFALMVTLGNGETRYVSQTFRAPPPEDYKKFRINHVVYSAAVGVIALISFSVALLFLMRSVSRPIESLQCWAASLDEKELDKPIPEFRYKELNALAAIIHGSLQNVRTTLNREREFVNHASHELRTPIAVIRSSAALLHRVIDSGNTKGNNALARVDHASKTMADLTETLLWLGRNEETALPKENVDLKAMVEALSQDLMYLLSGKDVNVQLDLSECALLLPKTASEIVIGNVIRNAYQHTQQGNVAITLSGATLTVLNEEEGLEQGENASLSITPNSGLDGGFGIGLKLIDKLCAKLEWGYSHKKIITQDTQGGLGGMDSSAKGYSVVLTLK